MKILTIVVAVLILVVLGVVVGKATGVLKFNKGILALDTENKIKVPNLVGKTEGEAKQILEESGLKCKVTARRESKKYDEGYVIEQNPEEGKRVKKGYDVEILVSSGKKSEPLLTCMVISVSLLTLVPAVGFVPITVPCSSSLYTASDLILVNPAFSSAF